MNDEDFEDLKSDVSAVLGPFIQPGDISIEDVRETREHLQEWHEIDELDFGIWSVEHSLEDAGIPREERIIVVDEIRKFYPELASGGER